MERRLPSDGCHVSIRGWKPFMSVRFYVFCQGVVELTMIMFMAHFKAIISQVSQLGIFFFNFMVFLVASLQRSHVSLLIGSCKVLSQLISISLTFPTPSSKFFIAPSSNNKQFVLSNNCQTTVNYVKAISNKLKL